MTQQLSYAIRAARAARWYASHGHAGLAGLTTKIAIGDLRRAVRKSIASHAWATPSIPPPESFFSDMGRNSMLMRRAVGIAQTAHYFGLTAEQVKSVAWRPRPAA